MSIWIHLIYAKENSTLLSIARSPAGSFQHHTRVFLVRLCVRARTCVCVWCGSSGGAIMADEWPSQKRSATLQGWCGETSSTHQLIKCQRVRLDRKRRGGGGLGRKESLGREGGRRRERQIGRQKTGPCCKCHVLHKVWLFGSWEFRDKRERTTFRQVAASMLEGVSSGDLQDLCSLIVLSYWALHAHWCSVSVRSVYYCDVFFAFAADQDSPISHFLTKRELV